MTNISNNIEVISKLEKTRIFDEVSSNFKECSSDYEVYILSFDDNDNHSFIIKYESVSKSDIEFITVIPIVDFDEFVLAEPSVLEYLYEDIITTQTAYSIGGEVLLTIQFDENGNAEIIDDESKGPGEWADRFHHHWNLCMRNAYEEQMSTFAGRLQVAIFPVATYAFHAGACVEIALDSMP
jgi:hypothetical protein